MCNIDVEVLGDVLVRSCNVDLTDGEVHATTISYTLCQSIELNGNADSDWLLIVNGKEVYMKQCIGYRMELKLFQDSRVILSVDLQIDDIDVGRVNQFA